MDEGVDPQNMCNHLYGAMGILQELSGQATQGLVIIFQEWLEEVEQECSRILENEPECNARDMAKRLGVPLESASFLMDRVLKSAKP